MPNFRPRDSRHTLEDGRNADKFLHNVLLRTLSGDEAASLMDDLLVVSSSRSGSYGFQFPFSLLRSRYSLRSHRILLFSSPCSFSRTCQRCRDFFLELHCKLGDLGKSCRRKSGCVKRNPILSLSNRYFLFHPSFTDLFCLDSAK